MLPEAEAKALPFLVTVHVALNPAATSTELGSVIELPKVTAVPSRTLSAGAPVSVTFGAAFFTVTSSDALPVRPAESVAVSVTLNFFPPMSSP